MKTFWKVLGFAALAAGLTPYKVEKNEVTGENSYQALLWKGSTRSDSDGKHIDINLNEGTLTAKVKEAVDKQKETHLFTDELSVEYSAGDAVDTVKDAAENVAEAAEEAAAEVKDIADDIAEAATEAAEVTEVDEIAEVNETDEKNAE